MLPRSIKILLTGVGAPGTRGTLYALRHNEDRVRMEILGADIRPEAIGRYWVDRFFILPAPESDDYVDRLLNLCIDNKIEIVVPQTTREVAVLSRLHDVFRRENIRILVADADPIEKSNNKHLLIDVFRELGLPHPASRLATTEAELVDAVTALGYPEKPVVVKPPVSSGMRGFRVIKEEGWDVRRFLNEKPSGEVISLTQLVEILRRGTAWTTLLVSEYMPGPEYSVDAFIGEHAAVAIPRLRRSIRSGISFDNIIEYREDLARLTLDVGRRIGLRYAFGFQFKLDAAGVPKVLECNPRVQGTMVASVFTGANVIWMSVRELLGIPVTAAPEHLRQAEFFRYWGGIGVSGEEIIEI